MTQDSVLLNRFEHRQDLHQSPSHARVMADIGWKTEHIPNNGQIFFLPLGPISISKFQRPKAIDLDAIKYFRKKHHTLTTYVEPQFNYTLPKNLGFKSNPFAHSTTSLIDLTTANTTLLSSFNQNTRRNLKETHTNLDIESIPLSDLKPSHISDLFTLQKIWYQQKKVFTYPNSFISSVLKNHKGFGHLHLAYNQNNPCAFLLSLYWDKIATYYLACADNDGYKLKAPTKLTWQALQTSKKEGCEIFDFGGIYDPRYPKLYKKWQGFTKFKQGFRPTVVIYPETKLLLLW